MTGPRDWDKELAEIDRAIGGSPGGPVRHIDTPASPSVPAGRSAAVGGRATVTTWVRVLLAAALAAAMPFWPYGRGCGTGLFLYLGAAAMVLVAGGWAAGSAWQRRRPRAHVVALLVILAGLALVAREVLPRARYAKVAARWTCG